MFNRISLLGFPKTGNELIGETSNKGFLTDRVVPAGNVKNFEFVSPSLPI